MVRKFIEALVIWVVVAVVLWLLAQLLLAFDLDVMQTVGKFLDRTNVVIGFLAGLLHFFFGSKLDLHR